MSEPTIEEENVNPGSGAVEAAAPRLAARILTWSVIAALIGAFLVVDYVTTARFYGSNEQDWLQAVLAGLCIGELNLIAVCVALAPGNIIIRVFWSLLLGMAMWYALVLGNRAAYESYPRSDAIVLGAVLLAGVLMLQVPLWIAKKLFRRRLTRGAEDAAQFEQEDRQFTLQHLFVATFLLAVAMSPLRQVLPPDNGERFEVGHQMSGVFVLAGAALLCNLLVTMPCIWWAFVTRVALLPVVLGWLVYCAVLTAIEFGTIWALLGPPGGPGSGSGDLLRFAFLCFLVNVTQCAAVFGTLRIFRALGFRLARIPAVR